LVNLPSAVLIHLSNAKNFPEKLKIKNLSRENLSREERNNKNKLKAKNL